MSGKTSTTSSQIPKPDKRDCPECHHRMLPKGNTCYTLDEDDEAPTLWQCPNCKNVEIL